VDFLVVEGSFSAREALCYLLLSFGIRGIPASTRSAAWSLIEETEIQGAIIDIDSQEVEGTRLIAELRENQKTRGLPVIVHTVQASKDFVLRMIESGIVGYLLKPFREDTAHAKLASILAKLADHNTQRRHIRVKPDPQELIRVHFRLPGYSALVPGKIIDISIGGIAVELLNTPDPGNLKVGTRIGKLQFSLGSRELTPSALIVLYKANLLAMRFETLVAADKTALERYIFKRISS
jgi:two-component system chemotaxis response regulator CheY